MNDQSKGPKTGLEPIAKRVPIERKIDLRFPNFEGLITGMSANLSTSGMFVHSDTPKPPGTEFDFSIRIEEWSPIQGVARVVWSRSRSEGPERPAGMGAQFIELDGQSRRMIRWLVDKHLQAGGKPFEVERVPVGASKQTRSRAPGRQGKRTAGRNPDVVRKPPPHPARTGSSKRLWGLLGSAILLMGGYAAYHLWSEDQPERGHGQAPETAAGTRSGTPSGDPAAITMPPTGEPEVSPSSRVSVEAVTAFVRTWSNAWESRDPETVIGLYSDSFDAAAYGGRRAWEAQIQAQMESADYLRLAVSALEIDFPSSDRATATFFRSWRSNQGDEIRRMKLEIEPVDNSWRILREQFVD